MLPEMCKGRKAHFFLSATLLMKARTFRRPGDALLIDGL
jgi:hypothetical protein